MKEKEIKEKLTAKQFYITQKKGTEPPFSGKYNNFYQSGIFHCVCCGNALFDSDNKYDSGSGWPSYSIPISSTAVLEERDFSHNIERVEVKCSQCGAHLGHVFKDGPPPTGLRYCINSLALEFHRRNKPPNPPPEKNEWGALSD